MTIKQLEQKIQELETRLKVLENTRVIVYPQTYTGPFSNPQPYTNPNTTPYWHTNSNINLC